MKTGFKILLSLLAGALAFGLSLVTRLFLMPVLAFAAFMAVEWGAVYLLPALIGTAVGTLFPFKPDAGTFAVLAMLLLIPAIMVFCTRRKLPHRYEALALAVVITLGTYLGMTLTSLIKGLAPHAEAVAVWEEAVVGPMREAFTGELKDYAEVADAFADFGDLLPDMLMPASILMGEGYALLLILFYRLFSRLFRVEPARMARLPEWRLPRNMHWGGLILVVMAVVVWIIGFERSLGIALSVGAILVPLFSVQGFAYLYYVFEYSNSPKIFRVMLCVLSAVFFPHSLILLSMFGVKEQISHARAAFKKQADEFNSEREEEREQDELNKYGYISEKDKKNKDDEKDDEKED